MERIVGGSYKLGRKIGSGSFGEIYLGHSPLSSVLLFIHTNSFFLSFFKCFHFSLQLRIFIPSKSSPSKSYVSATLDLHIPILLLLILSIIYYRRIVKQSIHSCFTRPSSTIFFKAEVCILQYSVFVFVFF